MLMHMFICVFCKTVGNFTFCVIIIISIFARYKYGCLLQQAMEIPYRLKDEKKDLIQQTGISRNAIAEMGRDENVSTDVLLKICDALNVDIGEIIEIVSNANGEKNGQAHT